MKVRCRGYGEYGHRSDCVRMLRLPGPASHIAVPRFLSAAREEGSRMSATSTTETVTIPRDVAEKLALSCGRGRQFEERKTGPHTTEPWGFEHFTWLGRGAGEGDRPGSSRALDGRGMGRQLGRLPGADRKLAPPRSSTSGWRISRCGTVPADQQGRSTRPPRASASAGTTRRARRGVRRASRRVRRPARGSARSRRPRMRGEARRPASCDFLASTSTATSRCTRPHVTRTQSVCCGSGSGGPSRRSATAAA